MFGKRPSELTPEDIRRVVSEQVQEGSEVELKETLPAKKNTVDPWISGQNHAGDYARNKLVEEVVAFANAYGGWLVLGIKETDARPKRALDVAPIRECADLADRLRQMCRDCIEPKLPVLEVAGVPMSDDGAGVIVFHVPRSRMAPHRHEQTRECYTRRADRTEKMTMREIQDLTLHVERGMAAIEASFGRRREGFANAFAGFAERTEAGQAFGLRASAIPTTPIFVERVHNNAAVRPPSIKLYGRTTDRGPYELSVPAYGGNWRPVLRGTRLVTSSETFSFVQEACSSGLIEYLLFVDRAHSSIPEGRRIPIFIDRVMGLVTNAICASEVFRRAAGAPDVEYALEFEVVVAGEPVPVGRYDQYSLSGYLGPFPPGKTQFPTYSLGQREEFEQVAASLERDFWNAAGHDWPDDALVVDFDSAFRELGIIAEAAGS